MATHLHHHGYAGTSGDPDDPCCALPAEFVRMRYYFGQRLGVVDLFDEQRYHAGKQRFHNLRAHGAGVLCGLTAERFTMPGSGEPTTVLRVARGAALDPCGREIVVGADQCIDIAAWFQKHQGRLEWEEGEHTLTVALCYRDCPSDPGPAPRDACGCDTGGCEFGRVREGFELKLLTEDEAGELGVETFPARAALAEALAAEDLGAALGALVGAACPQADEHACLGLATVSVTVGEDPLRVTAIAAPEHALAARAELLSTGALQELILGLAGQLPELSAGPRLGPLSFTFAPGGTSGELLLPVELALGGTPPAPIPLAESTFAPSSIEVRQFLNGQWGTPLTSAVLQVSYDAARAAIVMSWTSPAAGNYRLAPRPPFGAPTVDQHMRPLAPGTLARSFALTGSPLRLATPSF